MSPSEPATTRPRPLDETDIDWLKRLNDACVPAVNGLDEGALSALLGRAACALAAEVEGRPVAAIVCFTRGSTYESTNYAWFDAQPEPFLYIDRIVVEAEARRLGLARRLYREAGLWAERAGLPRLCCEVNEDPPNPQSLAFHTALGFRKLLSRINPSDGKRVAMLERRPVVIAD